MEQKTPRHIDFFGVWARRHSIAAKTELPRFAGWWNSLLEEAHDEEEAELSGLSFVYAVSGDLEIGRRAVNRLRHLLPGYVKLSIPTHRDMYPDLSADLGTANTACDLAYTYCFLYPLLEAKDRQAVFSELRRHGGGVIYEETQGGAWWGNAPNSNWCSIMLTALVFSAWVIEEDDAEEAARWLATAEPVLTRMLDMAGTQGEGIEGPGYWAGCYGAIIRWAEGLKNTGRGAGYQHPFWQRAVEFPLYMMRPDRSSLINLGDTGEDLGPSSFYFALAAGLRQGLAQWFGELCFDQGISRNERTSPLARGTPSIWDLIHYDPGVEVKPPDGLPTDRLFTGAHLASFRSGWDRDASYFVLKGGSNAWSHCHLDLNSFCIDADGDRLVADIGPAPYSFDYFTSVEPEVSTSWHNTLVVDGADQRQPPRYRMSFDLEEGGDSYCELSDFVSQDWLAMVRGDASTAYGDLLERFHREIVFLKPDCWVIYDDIRSHDVRTQRHYQWLLHSECPIMDNEDGTFQIEGSRVRLVIQPVLPIDHHHKFPPPRRPLNAERTPRATFHCLSLRPHYHHLWNISPTRSPYSQWDPRCDEALFGRDMQMLVVLSLVPHDTPYTAKVDPILSDSVHGVQIRRGERTDSVFFNRSDSTFHAQGVESDGEKVIVRCENGTTQSWVVVRGQRLACNGQVLPIRAPSQV